MPTFTAPLQHQSDPVSAAEVAEVPPPSPVDDDPHPEPRSHTMDEAPTDLDPDTTRNDANDGPLPAHPNGPPPPVMGPVKQENQSHGGPSGVAQPGPFTQGLLRTNAVGPGPPNNLNGPLGGPPHPPNVVGPLQGNTGPVPVGIPANDNIKWLAARFLYDPRSRIERVAMTKEPSGASKVLITLEIDETM